MRLLDGSATAYLLGRALAPLRRSAPGAVRVPTERGLDNLRAIGELGRAEGFDVLYMQQVSLIEPPGSGTGQDGWTECVREYAGFEPRVDLCPLFIDMGGRAEDYFVDMIHANEAGHALIADAIVESFTRLGWAGSPPENDEGRED